MAYWQNSFKETSLDKQKHLEKHLFAWESKPLQLWPLEKKILLGINSIRSREINSLKHLKKIILNRAIFSIKQFLLCKSTIKYAIYFTVEVEEVL